MTINNFYIFLYFFMSYEFILFCYLNELIKDKDNTLLCYMFFSKDLLDFEVYKITLKLLYDYLCGYLCDQLKISDAELLKRVEHSFNNITRKEFINYGTYLNDIFSFVYIAFQLNQTYRLLKKEAVIISVQRALDEYVRLFPGICIQIPSEQHFFFTETSRCPVLISSLQGLLLSSNYFLFSSIPIIYKYE